MTDTILAIALILASFLTAFAALVGFAMLWRGRDKRLLKWDPAGKDGVVFLFENEKLVDSTEAAGRILASARASGDDWVRLASILGPQFEGFSTYPRQALEEGPVQVKSIDETSLLHVEVLNGMVRIELSDAQGGEDGAHVDHHAVAAMREELTIHRDIAEHAPFLSWRENKLGEIIWANRAYLDLAEILAEGAGIASWPPARLFDTPEDSTGAPGAEAPRVKLRLPEEDVEKWFELHRAELESDTLFTAVPIENLIRAEASLSEFITTLTGTFAHLPIGLAIFNKERKLTLFNPALTDLTMFPAEFLCAQPTLFAFLDRLRDKRMMPEPKDYKGWRQAMSELEEKAVNGTYMETWFLPTGQTYRVTGQPHPGGALALLFEDISSEMSLSHRFRAELEMSQAVLDGLEEAVAVFTAGGILSMSNAAFAALWGTDPSNSMSQINVSEATFSWGRKCNPTPVWRQLRNFISEGGERKKWSAPVTMKDGRVIDCTFTPMVQGATMVTFAPAIAAPASTRLEPVAAQALT